MDIIQAFLVTSGRKDLAQDYFQKLALVVDKRPITVDYKTKNYEELMKFCKDTSTTRKLNNGSVDISYDDDIWQLHVSGRLKRIGSTEPYRHMFGTLKTSEDWDVAWKWLLNYLTALTGKRERRKENFESNKQEWIDLVREINFPDEFLSAADFDKIDNFLESYDEKKLGSDEKIKSLLTILNNIGSKQYGLRGSFVKYMENFPPTEKEYKKSINKYFDLVVKKTVSDRNTVACLSATPRFNDLVKNRKKKIDGNFWNVYVRNTNDFREIAEQ